MVNKIFILGNHIQALGIARDCRTIGCEVTLFTESGFSVARYSVAVKKTIVFKGKEVLLKILLELSGNKKDTFLIPTNDDMVSLLRDNYSLLNNFFYMGLPEHRIVDIFYNKRNTYQFAEEYDIPVPLSWYPNNIEDIVKISNQLNFPVIIKPAIMHDFHKKTRKKAFKCNNSNDLISTARRLHDVIPINELIIQEFLDGGPENLFSYGVLAQNGRPVVSLMANRIRQNPMTFGNSTTFAVSCNIQDIKSQAERILQLVNYSGIAEVEFMYDKRRSVYMFLEINPRPWKWHTLSNAYNFGFVSEWIKLINNQPSTKPENTDQPVAWVERLTDITVIFKEFIKGKSIFRKAFNSYKIRKKVNAVWSLRDPLPAIMYLLLAPILFFKRH